MGNLIWNGEFVLVDGTTWTIRFSSLTTIFKEIEENYFKIKSFKFEVVDLKEV